MPESPNITHEIPVLRFAATGMTSSSDSLKIKMIEQF